ncbi:MAG: Tryptophan-tRNA ligase, partial [Candidatus Woesebacteria bacterium GW2011_GWF1_46_13]
KAYTGAGIGYSELKEDLAKAIYGELKPIQERRKKFEESPSLVDKILAEGSARARQAAGETLEEIRKAMGLI